MARFSDILRGRLARKPVFLSLPQAVGAVPEPTHSEAQVVRIDLTVLLGDHEARALQATREYAISKGVTDPKPGDPIYDLALMVNTLLLACVDPDSPEAAPRQFFASAQEILEGLSRDQIQYLAQSQELWANELSPYEAERDEKQVLAFVIGLADQEDPRLNPFENMRPGTVVSYLRTTARLLVLSLQNKLPPGTIDAISSLNTTSRNAEPS